MDVAELLRETGRNTVGLGDAALTLGKSATWLPVSGYAGLAKLLRTGDLNAAVRAIEESQELAGPSTREGAEYLSKLGKGVDYLVDPWKKNVLDPIGDKSPALGAALAAGAAVVDPTRIGRTVRGLGRAAVPSAMRQAQRGAIDVDAITKALREAPEPALRGPALDKRAGSATYEYVPGANVGHVPEMLDAPFEHKREYGTQGAWATPAPIAPVDAGHRDALYRAAGFKQQPTLEAVGQYENSLGAIENNPVHIARPLLDFTPGTAAEVNPHTLRSVEAVEGLRGLIDAQEAAAMNLPVTQRARKGKTSLLLERPTQPSAEELQRLTAVLRDTGMGVTPTSRGALLMNFADAPQAAQKAALKARGQLAEAYPGAELSKAAYEGVYVPGVTPASEAGKGIATARALQRFGEAPPELARNVGESDEVRRLIREKISRDETLGSARPDIQKTREFFGAKDWPRVVELIRKGMKPAAAMSALGFSLEGMAADQQH
jgi:hypothetical protein